MTDEASRRAILVAHGSPADPQPQEGWMMALATRVRLWLPGWQVAGTTLALPGALEAALAALPDAVIYPFFMAEGWFTRKTLPRRLQEAGAGGSVQLPAFGHDPGMADLLGQTAAAARVAHGLPADATLLLAAHGSQVSRASATITESLAAQLRAAWPASVVTGYVEEAPFLADAAAAIRGPALCLPFFATRAGHVSDDVPHALRQAGFSGPLLPAIGEHPDAARMIAQALMNGR